MIKVEFLQKNRLLFLSTLIIGVTSLLIFLFTETAYLVISETSILVRNIFGRYYLYLGLGCVLFLLVIAILPFGRKRLGKTGTPPEFSTLSWLAMLYSAGMGAGILLRAVQEPVYMYHHLPLNTGISRNEMALEYTFYQWGLTPWAFYGLFALILGYTMSPQKPMLLMSRTLTRAKTLTWPLRALDLMVVLTTVAGIIGAVSLGTTQIMGGINFLLDSAFDFKLNASILILIFTLAFISAWQGLNKGIKWVSNINIALTTMLLLFTVAQGEIMNILTALAMSVYHYIFDFIPLSLASGIFDPGKEFLTNWTYYYWAFWLSWAPFTGIFIARISIGRTIRQFILGVLVIPSLASFTWFTVFGSAAFDIIKASGAYKGQFSDEFSSIFEFFSYLPFASWINPLILVLLVGFLVTSVDSAIYVLSMFSDKGKIHPNKKHRLIWAVLLGLSGVALLFLSTIREKTDVLNILQILLITTSLPFALLIPVIVFQFLKRISKTKST
ncbi:BCCT family transporter [Robertkochia flava]|uniref:BCCT family transporter n=1 Tax=Robertkochia flava TaxID=3447986 RepID=UPI001CCAF231|nr:BCCT family transporter [Robertkochia marina]